jgi:hypothetical protein
MKKPIKRGRVSTSAINNNPKLGLFKTSDVANARGAALNRDGSIMRQAEALGSKSDISGQTRAIYGVSKKEPMYQYGFGNEGSSLAASVAQPKRGKKKAGSLVRKKGDKTRR